MSILQTMILGFVQGLTEFLPVSSFAHLLLLQSWMGVSGRAGALPEAVLHLGTALSVLICFYRDFIRILVELLGMLMDLVGNLHLWFVNLRNPESALPYARIVTGTWRRLALLVTLSSIPTALIGYSARRLVTKACLSPFLPGACMLITGMFLLVTDLGRVGEKRSAREAGSDAAMWLGICQGLAVFPGISRGGLTICAGLLCGLGKKFIIKFSLIMSVPACIGAFLVEAGNFASPGIDGNYVGALFLGVCVSALTGCLFLRPFMKLVSETKLRIFAVYNFLIGILMLIRSFS